MATRYCEGDYDGEGPPPEFWWQATVNALRGRRGQAFLRELHEALLTLPEKRLISGHIVHEGKVCLIGAVVRKRALERRFALKYADVATATEAEILAALEREMEWYESDLGMRKLGEKLGIAGMLAWRLGWENDEGCSNRTPEARYSSLLNWVELRLRNPKRSE